MEKKKLSSYIKDEFSGWKTWEVMWLMIACAIILALSVYWKDTVMATISATIGVACVVCTGKGKLSAYIIGMVNTLLYAMTAY